MPPTIANGTNRIGIFAQTGAATLGFKKFNSLQLLKSYKWVFLFILAGAIIGTIVASNISNDSFFIAYKYLMILVLISLFIKPKRWLQSYVDNPQISILQLILYFLLGIYAGFINMGFGILFLVLSVIGSRFPIIKANVLKNIIVFFYTAVVLSIFCAKGLVDWRVGLIIAIGQASGGYFAAYWASNFDNADKWAYRLLILMVTAILIKVFGLHIVILNLLG